MRIIYFLILITTVVHAAPGPYSFEVKHSRTNLSFEWTGKSILVKDRQLNLEIHYLECNKALLDDFFEVDQELWKDRPAPKPDPVLVIRKKETFSAARASRLGGHLVSMKDKMRLLKAQADAECRQKQDH